MLFIFKIENMNESFKNNIKSNKDIILSMDWICSDFLLLLDNRVGNLQIFFCLKEKNVS